MMAKFGLGIVGAMTLVVMSAAAHPPAINTRRAIESSRIRQGVVSGSLTHAETARLRAMQRSIGAQIRRDRIDGGGLNYRERLRIDARQDHLNREIFRQKHDFQHR